jgi:hypothetical protein
MGYVIDLTSTWAKLERADKHIKTLEAAIQEKWGSHSILVPLTRKFEAKKRAVVFRIGRVIKVPDDWSLIVADAVHNLRCALDHLAWQLALRHYKGRSIPKRLWREIQFPVVTQDKEWPHCREHFTDADADKLKNFQPFKAPPPEPYRKTWDVFREFFGARGVSNIDKHRRLNVVYFGMDLEGIHNEARFVACEAKRSPTGAIQLFRKRYGYTPKPGDEVLRICVTPTGPNPDVEFDPRFTAKVAMHESWDVLTAINAAWKGVESVLREFDPGQESPPL